MVSKYMRLLDLLPFLLIFCVPSAVLAQAQIHQCTDADGGVVYSQLPCKDGEPRDNNSTEVPELKESPEAASVVPEPPEPETAEPETAESRAACKRHHRDAIDEIDAEIRREYSPEKDGEYKQRLLELTRRLRAC